ncbi:hypothetical protein Lal_00047355 [Lupinus albus]|uniref:Uncharacterized protein n=1 Tax=Lupinus albus TaxID=3870 RepID=A0A6A4QWW1_LUPAL|nr:hypothetical protein Lalb_Chr02g0152111 [Lupinus albus]KAF1878684.1 hypothetical protein Lal_00047355 [Lupinus albus]
MSTFFVSKFVFLLILLMNPPSNNNGGSCSTLLCVAATRPLEQNAPKFNTLKPEKGHGLQSRNIEACMPKGPRRNSAPSRYSNYEPLGSTCSSAKVVNDP